MDYRWYFTKEQLENTPSRKCGMDADKELSQRQQAANFIQDMGQRLQVTQLCINTAIVYMHRFYVFHSFTSFHRTALSTAALFLAAKVEEQPRKLEHIIKVSQLVLQKGNNLPERRSDYYAEQAHELVMNENLLLQTLGFDVAIDHPHTYVVRCCHLVRASKDLSQTSYFMASNSLHLTTMCLLYKPTVVACFCIHLACKWSNWEIPKSNEGRNWFEYIDANVNKDILEKLTSEFLTIFDKCPSRLKKRIMLLSNNSQNSTKSSSSKISATYNAVDPEYDQLINPVPSSIKNNDPQHGAVTFNPVGRIQSGTKSNTAITGTVTLPTNNNSFVNVHKTNNTVILPSSNNSVALSSTSKHPVNNIYSNNSTSTGSVVKPIVPPKINNNVVQGYASKLGPVQANNNNLVIRPNSEILKLPPSKPSSNSLVVVPPTSSVSVPRQRKDYGTTDPNVIKNVVSEVILQNISNKSEPPPNNIDISTTEIDGTKLFIQGGTGAKTHSIFSPHPVIANTNGNVTSPDNKAISINPKWDPLSPKCEPVSPPDSPPVGHHHHHHHENNEKRHKTKKKDKHKEKRHKEKKEKHRHHKHHHHHHNNEDIGQKEPTATMAAEGIKIKIPKEKLIDIPSSIPKEKLIIKINKDQILAAPSSSTNYFKVKINKESKKSKKRKHSSSYEVEDDVSDNFNNSYEHITKKTHNFSNR